MSNTYCPESLQKEIMLHFNIILLNTPMKLQFCFGWVFIYLTKRHTSRSVSETEFSDNVTDTIYITSGLFPTDPHCVERQMPFGEDRQTSRR